jgi:hypothetical protein
MVVVEVALSIVNDPGTYAIWKLPGVVPFTIAAIAVVPAFGPTLAGLFVHAKSPVYAPLTTQAEGVFVFPSNIAVPPPAVAVTGALST